MKEIWDYIYGRKSHVNLAGKILIGIPLAPFVVVIAVTWLVLDLLFTKKKRA